MKSPEDEFNDIIDAIEMRCMATDGPVTPTLQEATEKELSRLWELVNEISPKRKALARKQLKGTATDEVNEYLRKEGLDPEQVGREGSVFVKTLLAKIKLEQVLEGLMTNPYISLGDLVYTVRDREGKGWEGEYVKKWSDTVVNAESILKQLKNEKT